MIIEGNIKCIRFAEYWKYRQVAAMQETMEKKLVMDALTMALAQRKINGEIIHHSDRGSEYASKDYQGVLEGARITYSMSRKGKYWDNAVVESSPL